MSECSKISASVLCGLLALVGVPASAFIPYFIRGFIKEGDCDNVSKDAAACRVALRGDVEYFPPATSADSCKWPGTEPLYIVDSSFSLANRTCNSTVPPEWQDYLPMTLNCSDDLSYCGIGFSHRVLVCADPNDPKLTRVPIDSTMTNLQAGCIKEAWQGKWYDDLAALSAVCCYGVCLNVIMAIAKSGVAVDDCLEGLLKCVSLIVCLPFYIINKMCGLTDYGLCGSIANCLWPGTRTGMSDATPSGYRTFESRSSSSHSNQQRRNSVSSARNGFFCRSLADCLCPSTQTDDYQADVSQSVRPSLCVRVKSSVKIGCEFISNRLICCGDRDVPVAVLAPPQPPEVVATADFPAQVAVAINIDDLGRSVPSISFV